MLSTAFFFQHTQLNLFASNETLFDSFLKAPGQLFSNFVDSSDGMCVIILHFRLKVCRQMPTFEKLFHNK